MKRHLLGLTAIVLAFAFSAFTKAKYMNDVLKLTVQPTVPNRVMMKQNGKALAHIMALAPIQQSKIWHV